MEHIACYNFDSRVWLPTKCDYWTDGHTDTGQSFLPVFPVKFTMLSFPSCLNLPQERQLCLSDLTLWRYKSYNDVMSWVTQVGAVF